MFLVSSTMKLPGSARTWPVNSYCLLYGRKAWEDLASKLGAKFDIERATAERSEKIMIAAKAIYDAYNCDERLSKGKGSGKRTFEEATAGSSAPSGDDASSKKPAWSNNYSKQSWSNNKWSK